MFKRKPWEIQAAPRLAGCFGAGNRNGQMCVLRPLCAIGHFRCLYIARPHNNTRYLSFYSIIKKLNQKGDFKSKFGEIRSTRITHRRRRALRLGGPWVLGPCGFGFKIWVQISFSGPWVVAGCARARLTSQAPSLLNSHNGELTCALFGDHSSTPPGCIVAPFGSSGIADWCGNLVH